MTPILRWHDDVPGDLRAVLRLYGRDAYDEARRIIMALPQEPRSGEWLDADGRTGDLSTGRKLKFGPIETDGAGVPLGPALRLVYRLLPSNTDAQQVEVLAVARRRDLEAYALAGDRLGSDPV